jgi:hypothetical protein
LVTFFPPITDLPSPGFHPFIVLRITIFQIFEESLDGPAPGGKDRQADHDEKDSLQKGKKKPKDSEPDEEPAGDPNRDFLHFILLQEYIIIIAIRKNH